MLDSLAEACLLMFTCLAELEHCDVARSQSLVTNGQNKKSHNLLVFISQYLLQPASSSSSPFNPLYKSAICRTDKVGD